MQRVLAEVADSNNLDYLLIIEENGRIVASNSGHSAGMVLPRTMWLSRLGRASSLLPSSDSEPSVLELLGKICRVRRLCHCQRVATIRQSAEVWHTCGCALSFGGRRSQCHVGRRYFAQSQCALDRAHARACLPVGTLPDNTEGLVLLTVDDTIISLSRQRREGGRFTGGHLTDGARYGIGEG